jgi:hypothetical protein
VVRTRTWAFDTPLRKLRASSPIRLPVTLPRIDCTSELRLLGRCARLMSGKFDITCGGYVRFSACNPSSVNAAASLALTASVASGAKASQGSRRAAKDLAVQ